MIAPFDRSASGAALPGDGAPVAMQTTVSHVAVVVPSFRVRESVLQVIADIPAFVRSIYVVDDACPEGSGKYVEEHCVDPRVRVLYSERNMGVGSAVMAGYVAAVADGAHVIVKMDGDGQMDAAALPHLILPIVRGQADYTKGNRFYDLAQIGRMPRIRIVGNAILSFMTKISSGYWDLFDPTNGYTAIHAHVVSKLPLEKISKRYFFETDMLFRLNIARAVVADVPIDARYGAETSNLLIRRVVFDFGIKHARNTFKRVFYNYFLRDLSLASIELLLGTLLLVVGNALGMWFWVMSARTGINASAGSVMLVALQVIIGLQFMLGFLAYDIASVPRRVQHPLLAAPAHGDV